MENRQKRLGELIKQEISEMMLREIKDPRIGFVSITSVDMTADLRHAKVFISVLGSESERKSSLAGLRSATGFIRRELGHRLRLKYTPEISITYDKSIEEGVRIVALIDSVTKERTSLSDDE
ncbi:30S ribosome-binding factor RbfA [Candidatus Poribacteria bacterium]|nr:30S ribosome-binding factor RbfA [Candidatus Poribacteria bacterium]